MTRSAAWTKRASKSPTTISSARVFIFIRPNQNELPDAMPKARVQLDAVTNSAYADLKHTLEHNNHRRENKAANASTNVTARPIRQKFDFVSLCLCGEMDVA